MSLSRLISFRVYEADAADIEAVAEKHGFPCLSEFLRNFVYDQIGKAPPIRDISTLPFKQQKKKTVGNDEDLSELTEKEKIINQKLKSI